MQRKRWQWLSLAVICGCAVAAQGQPYLFTNDFEAYALGAEAMFQQPDFSGSTTGIITGSTSAGASYTPAQVVQWTTADGSAADMTDKAYEIAFPWATPAENVMSSGVRCTTSAVLNLPNPSIHLDGKIRFKMAVTAWDFFGDVDPDIIFTTQDVTGHPSILVCLAIRETGNDLPQGTSDTGGGDLEYVYLPASEIIPVADSNGLITFPPGGKRYHALTTPWAPIKREPPATSDFTTVEFDLSTVVTRGFANNLDGVDTGGDGALDATINPFGHGVNRGVLEAIIFTNDPADDTGGVPGENFYIYIDDVQFEAPVEEPTPPPTITSPILRGATSVTVTNISTNATQVKLKVDNGVDPDQTIDPAGATLHVFTLPHPAEPGDVYTATQTVDGKESVNSVAVAVSFPGPAIGLLPKDGDTTVRITGIDPETEEIELFVEDVSYGTTATTNGVFTTDVSFGTPLEMGQAVYATQIVNGAASDPSVTVIVTTNGITEILCDDFEYANQAAFDAVWTAHAGDTTLTLSDDPYGNATPGGSKGAYSPAGGSGVNAYQSQLVTPFGPISGTDTHPVIFNISYRDGLVNNVLYRQSAEIRTATDLTPLLQLGKTNEITGNYHSARLVDGPGWVNLNGFGQPQRTNGWCVLTAVVKSNRVDIYINGALARQNLTFTAGATFTQALIGQGLSSVGGDAYYDDLCIKIGALNFNTIATQPPPPPTVVSPIIPGATKVTVTDVSTNAELVSLYLNGGASPVVPPIVPVDTNSVTFTIPAAQSGHYYTATHTVGGLTSGHSEPVYVLLPGPTLYKAPAAGETSVRVLGINVGATLVEVMVGGVVRGTLNPAGSDDVVVPLIGDNQLPYALAMGEVITARITVGPVQSVDSASETVTDNVVSGTLLCDDFEAYTDQASFEVIYDAVNFTSAPNKTIHIFDDQVNATVGGSNSIRSTTTASHRTTPTGNPFPPLMATDTTPIVFNVSIYDPTGSAGTDEWASMVAWSTLGGAPATEFFLAEIGMATAAFTSGPETHYQGRLVGNGGPSWFQLNLLDGPTRSIGWHVFTMVVKGPKDGNATGNEIDIYVDGLLARKNMLLTGNTTTGGTSVYTPLIGSGQLSSDGSWYDDYCVQLGPVRFNNVEAECPTLVGDADKDGDVDVADMVRFADCLDGNGPTSAHYPAGCGCADVDGNLRIDLIDFAELQELF